MAPVGRDGMAAFPASQRSAETFRFITCGSVDDGKSTLIGRLLYESKAVFDDQLKSLERDSRQYGTQGELADLALLVDGLQAEREQGITIDVAYRFFATARRRYIVADTPGHEQYTRNMATGASTADLAVILLDARKGVLTQTRRHTRIAAMMGIRHVVLAVNKIDLVGFDGGVFAQLAADYAGFAGQFGFDRVQAIPVSALDGDNVLHRSERTPWYGGPSLMEYLDGVDLQAAEQGAFRMAVQWVNRPGPDFRGLCGRIARGSLRVGDRLCVLPSGQGTHVARIVSGFDDAGSAGPGDSVTVVLADEVDASRGDVLAAADDPPALADRFQARLLWMGEQPMTPGRQYLIKLGTKEATATVTRIRHVEDVNSGQQQAASSLAMNGIATVDLATSVPLVFEPYRRDRALGGFILIDKLNFATVGAGMIDSGVCRDVHWQALDVNKGARALQKGQTPRCIWFTGLSGSGKSTLANLLEKRLHSDGRHTYLLDGDNVRQGLNCDLGFTEADRVENMRRVAEVAKLMVDAGLIVLVSFISPFKNERRMARELFKEGEFVEVFIDTPIAECERRDVKGLYSKARKGALKNFTGIDSPYERPEMADVIVRTVDVAPETCVGQILAHLDSLD